MSVSHLELLPEELWFMICEYVELNEPRNLKQLAGVNKWFRSVTLGLSYRYIQISVPNWWPHSPTGYKNTFGSRQWDTMPSEPNAVAMAENVAHLSAKLDRLGMLNEVRCLAVRFTNLNNWNRPILGGTQPGYVDSEGYHPALHLEDKHWSSLDSSTWAKTYDFIWKPLARLLARLQGIKDLAWHGIHQFPPCLLKVLHEHHPACRLSIDGFHIFSICNSTIDPYEVGLLSSPCLHHIHMALPEKGDTHLVQSPGLLDIAYYTAVFGLAQHVKSITSDNDYGARVKEIGTPEILVPAASWEPSLGLIQGTHQNITRPTPRRLISRITVGSSLWRLWTTKADLSQLEVLHLVCRPLVHDALAAVAMGRRFDCLQDLSLCCQKFSNHGEKSRKEAIMYTRMLESFIKGLDGLRKLELLRCCPDISIADCQLSRKLRQLTLHPDPQTSFALSLTDIQAMVSQCQQLEYVEVPIRRSRGDQIEAAMYRELRALRHLQSLFLWLDMSPSEPQGSCNNSTLQGRFDEQDLRPLETATPWRIRHLRELYINAAIDYKLAYTIFNIIYPEQKDPGSGGSARLWLSFFGEQVYENSLPLWQVSVTRQMGSRGVEVVAGGDLLYAFHNEDLAYEEEEEEKRRVFIETLLKSPEDKVEDWHSFPIEGHPFPGLPKGSKVLLARCRSDDY